MRLLQTILLIISACQIIFALNTRLNTTFPDLANTSSISNITSKRYAQLLTSSSTVTLPIVPWPYRRGPFNLHEGYIRRIPYCFVDERSHSRINLGPSGCKFAAAVQLWADALGGFASRQTGHSLAVQPSLNPRDYCCTRYTYGRENAPLADGELHCEWDAAKWPDDALAIHWVDEVKMNEKVAESQVGYTEEVHDGEAGRHWMRVGDRATPATIAHELGHVFGMSHEHQRWDRDDHVEFRCENLAWIYEAANRLSAERNLDEHRAMEMLCSNRDVAVEYESPSADYVRGDGLDPNANPLAVFDGPSGFDVDSIMMYSSMQGSAPEDQANVHDAVLVKTQRDAHGNKVPAQDWRIMPPTRVSPRDAEFVRTFYPWDEARAQQHRNGRKRDDLE